MIEKIKELEGRISTMEEAMNNVVRVGTVTNRDDKKHRCRVEFKDNDGIISYWCQVIAKKTHKDKEYWLPDLDEMVVCLFLPFGREIGFIIGSAYNAKDSVPGTATKDRYLFKDSSGNEFLIDRSCGKTRLTTTEFHIFGKLVVHGKIYDEEGNLTQHTNRGLLRDDSGGPPPWGCGS